MLPTTNGIRRAKDQRASREPRILTVLSLIILIVVTVLLFSSFLVSDSCAKLRTSHESLISGLLELSTHKNVRRGETQLRDVISPPGAHLQARLVQFQRDSTRFLLSSNELKSQGRSCKVRQLNQNERYAFEFSVSARYQTDGILLYLLSIAGATRRTFVEIDNAVGDGIFGAGVLFAHTFNWTMYGMYEAWSGYEDARQFYTSSAMPARVKTSATVIDAGRVFGKAIDISTAHAFGGGVDVAAIFPGNGDEMMFFDTFQQSRTSNRIAWLKPRFVLVFYLDFWGGHPDKWRIAKHENLKSDGFDYSRRRLYAGGSIAAIVRMANRAGYRLIWCLGSAPIAVFVNSETGVQIPSINGASCIESRMRYSATWVLDAEAMWDEAQTFQWNS